jgi:hypothetical protein
MTRKIFALFCTFTAGAIAGHFAIPSTVLPVWAAETHKRVFMTHLFTGPDGQTHAEEIELKFDPGKPGDISKLMQVGAAEVHRNPANSVDDWHRAPRRQYVITLSGHGEIEVAGGKKIPSGPGHIDLVEDVSGKGHVTRIGPDDRVTLQLPLADQAGR